MSVNLTIGIPIHNEEKNIQRLLDELSAFASDIPEIIVVSSGSTDQSDEIVESFPHVRLVVEPERRGKMHAIKRIIRHASFENIVLIDGDVRLHHDALRVLSLEMTRPGCSACTGRVCSLKGSSRFMNMLSYISCEAWHTLRNESSGTEFLYPSGHLLTFKRKTIAYMTLQDNIVNDDALIGLNLYENDIVFRYSPEAIVYIHPPSNLKDFFIQKVRTRLGRRQLVRYTRLLKRTEKEWRRHVWCQPTPMLKLYACALLSLDAAARLLAAAKLAFNRHGNHHLWKPVDSTK